jgi:diguanylate cyclase (GGDEF)-like protein/PAS domain S-box-containing protein
MATSAGPDAEPRVPGGAREGSRRRRARALRLAAQLRSLPAEATAEELLHALSIALDAQTAFVAELDAPAAAWRVVASACGAGALLAGSGSWPASDLPRIAAGLRRSGFASVAVEEAADDARLLARAGIGRLTVLALDPGCSAVLGVCGAPGLPPPDLAERALLGLAASRLTAQRRASAALADLARSEERLALTVHGAAAGWFEWDLEQGRIAWSDQLRALFGYGPDDHPETALWRELVDAADAARVERAIAAHFDGASPCFDETFRGRRKDGSTFWAWVRFVAARDAQGALKRAVGTVLDVSAQVRVEAELAAEHARMRTIFAALADAVLTVDGAGCVEHLNPAAARLLCCETLAVRGRPVETVVRLGAPFTQALERCVLSGALEPVPECALTGAGSTPRFVAGSVAPLAGGAGGAVVVLRDVSEARALRERLAHQASHDPLTGLLNRREIELRLAQALDAARRGAGGAFLYLDLDQFKVLNDGCGHAAGDALLVELGGVLREALPTGAAIGRLGGDEFGVLLPSATPGQALRVAEALRARVAALRFTWDGRCHRLGASIGIAAVDAAAGRPADVLAAADTACFAAKDAGRDRVHAGAAGDAELARRRRDMDWVTRLAAACDGDGLVLHRQPIVALAAGGARHHELLVRYRADDGGLVLPEAFVPAAERYGLMPRLDRWVVARALAWLADHPEAPGMYAVNLSGQALADPRFHGFLREALAATGVAPERLCLEVTETTAIADLDAAARFVRALRGLGCRAALDDFGTGLASFAYLKRLPLDLVKIDGSFVRGVAGGGVDREVVRAVRAVACQLGVATVAECVEDGATLALLADLGVDFVQGWAVGRPEPLPEAPRSGLAGLGGAARSAGEGACGARKDAV